MDVLASELLQSFQIGFTHGKRLHSGNGTVTNGRRLKSGNDSGMGIDATALHLNLFLALPAPTLMSAVQLSKEDTTRGRIRRSTHLRRRRLA